MRLKALLQVPGFGIAALSFCIHMAALQYRPISGAQVGSGGKVLGKTCLP